MTTLSASPSVVPAVNVTSMVSEPSGAMSPTVKVATPEAEASSVGVAPTQINLAGSNVSRTVPAVAVTSVLLVSVSRNDTTAPGVTVASADVRVLVTSMSGVMISTVSVSVSESPPA